MKSSEFYLHHSGISVFFRKLVQIEVLFKDSRLEFVHLVAAL